MYHNFRIVVASLAIMLLCVLSSPITIAYFTDTDSKLNNFVIGNAATTLTIYADISSNPRIIFDPSIYSPLTANQEIPFYPEAENTGNIPVFQRFRIAVPIALKDTFTLSLPNTCTLETETESTCSTDDYTIVYNPSVLTESSAYAEYYITSKNPLNIGEKTTDWWETSKILIGNISDIDNSLFQCTDNTANNCILGVNVYSDVIQTTGFENALAAFANLEETY